MTPYERGHRDALCRLGLYKEAVSLAGAGRWIRTNVPKAVGTAGRILFGRPRQFMRELAEGKALAPGSTVREGFAAPGMLGKVLNYGLPAYSAYSTLTDPNQPDKAKAIGQLAGGLIAGNAASGPFGMIGSSIASGIGTELGGMIGSGVGKVLPSGSSAPPPRMQGPPPPMYPQLYSAGPSYYPPPRY